MQSFLLTFVLAIVIWSFGYIVQCTAGERLLAPRWLARLCLVSRKDNRLGLEATLMQLFAYELLPLMFIVRTFVPATFGGVVISVGVLACLVVNFLALKALLIRD